MQALGAVIGGDFGINIMLESTLRKLGLQVTLPANFFINMVVHREEVAPLGIVCGNLASIDVSP